MFAQITVSLHRLRQMGEPLEDRHLFAPPISVQGLEFQKFCTIGRPCHRALFQSIRALVSFQFH